MSEATLNNLLEYLYETLTPSNMLWVAEHLTEHARNGKDSLKPYTIEELHRMVKEGERQMATGQWQDSEDMFRELEEEFEKEELQFTEAV